MLCEAQASWIAQGLTKSSSMRPDIHSGTWTSERIECPTNEVFKVLFLWHLATLYRVWDPHPKKETRARELCTGKCWAKWQAASKHDIKTKHSNLICEGYLKIGSRPFSCRSVATHSHNLFSLGSAAWAVALHNPGAGQQPQPVSLPEAFGGNRRL